MTMVNFLRKNSMFERIVPIVKTMIKSILLFLSLFIFSTAVMAQTDTAVSPIVGKWKVIVFDAGIHRDFKTGHTAYPENLKKALEGKQDSAITMDLLTMLADNFKNYYFVFTADGKYQEIRESKIKQEGVYKIDEVISSIETTCMTRIGTPAKQQFNYHLKGKVLSFSLPLRDKKMSLQCEKED